MTAFKVKKPDADTAIDSYDVRSSRRGSEHLSDFSSEDFDEETLPIKSVRFNLSDTVLANDKRSKVPKEKEGDQTKT